MADFGGFRARHAQQHSRVSLLPTIVGASAAFAVGVVVVFFWNKMPEHWASLLPAWTGLSDELSFSGDRMGRAVTAPLLPVCVTKDLLNQDPSHPFDPGTTLEILATGSWVKGMTAVLGAAPQHTAVELATKWGTIADCAYQKTPLQLCDIDNRALAVQAANTFMRQADRILAEPNSYAATAADLGALRETRNRVLDSVRERAKMGVLIAADFRPFAPKSVHDLLSKTVSEQNACAKK